MPGGTTTPWEVIMAWPPRSDNPIRRGWGLTIFTILAYTLTVVVLGLRLWARHIIQRNAGIDDIVILVAVIPLTGLVVCIAGGGRWWYFDRHAWDLTAQQAIDSRKLAMAIELLYLYSSGLTKVSILLFYRRMVHGSYSPAFLWTVRACIGFVVCYTTAFTLTLFLGCRPLNAFWHKVDLTWVLSHDEGKDWVCFNEAANLIGATAFSVVQDFIACLMPTIIFWKLSLPLRQKIALSVVFGMGIFTCIAGTVRFYYIYQIFYTSYDTNWIAYPTWMWTSIEIHLGIICASLPALKIYFQNYVKVSQLRVYLDSWRGDEGTMTTTIGTGKRAPTTTLISGSSNTDSKWRSGRFEDIHDYNLESAGIRVTREFDTKEEYTSVGGNDDQKFPVISIESQPVSPASLISPTLTRQSTGGSRRLLRIHDASDERRPSYAISGLLDEDSGLSRKGSIENSPSTGVLRIHEVPDDGRPRSYPAATSLGEEERFWRKGSAVEKRNSAG